MRSRFITCLTLLMAMDNLPSSASPLRQPEQTYICDATVVSVVDDKTRTETQKILQKGPYKYRVERMNAGRKALLIGNGKDVWIIAEWLKRGTHAIQDQKNLDKQRMAGRYTGGELAGFLKMGAKKIGTRVVDGQTCDVYQRHDAVGTAYTLWVLPGKEQLVRRAKTEGTVNTMLRKGEQVRPHYLRTEIDYTNWKVGVPIDDSLFKPPTGITLAEASPLKKNAPPAAVKTKPRRKP